VSLPYSVAVALIEGGALPPQNQDEKLGDPQIRRLSGLVKVTPDESLPRGVSCHMTLETEGGARYNAQVDYPRGSIQNPMTSIEMDQKVHMLGDEVLGAEAVTRLLDLVARVETLATIDDLMALAGGAAAEPAKAA
jgi:2-methylcitrate dehydratase PrpD